MTDFIEPREEPLDVDRLGEERYIDEEEPDVVKDADEPTDDPDGASDRVPES